MKYSVICVLISAFIGYLGGSTLGWPALLITAPISLFLGYAGAKLDGEYE